MLKCAVYFVWFIGVEHFHLRTDVKWENTRGCRSDGTGDASFVILLIESTSLMLVVVSGLVRLTSSFIQGRVYWDTDAPNMTPCRT